MSLKGRVKPDHIPLNKYRFAVAGLGIELTALEVTGLEIELNTVELPDRTKASGGQVGTAEVTVKLPMHHEDEFKAMESWFKRCQDGVTIDYKLPVTLTQPTNSGNAQVLWILTGVFPMKRVIADMAMENEGELATVEWTFSVDNIEPAPF